MISGRELFLVVEDDPDVLASMVAYLEVCDRRVASAGNAQCALNIVKADDLPDIVITDYRMPGMNGLDLVQELRRRIRPDLPAILLTGEPMLGDIAVSIRPAVRVLEKPQDPDELLEIADAMIAEAAGPPPAK